jgi:CheY-like chemotaxis protein
MAKIVFCEDDPMIQKLIQAAMRGSGHDLHIASDGEEGLALIRRVRPDLIFSDVSMPKLDGFQLGDALKGSPETAAIPLIFVTASVQRAQIAEAKQHGAAAVLPKPFTMAELRARVAEFLPAGS